MIIFRRRDSNPGRLGAPERFLRNAQIMSIYRGDFPSCDSGGGAGPSARARAYRGATWRALRPSAPDPLDVCARTPRASRIPPPPLPTVLAKARAGAVACGTRRPHWASGTPNDRTLLGTEWPRGRVWKEKKKKRKRMNVNSEDRERERRASARDRSRGGHRHAVAVADRNDDDDAELFSFASFLSSFFLFMISE